MSHLSLLQNLTTLPLQPHWPETNKEKWLEAQLVRVYALALELTYTFDSKDYPAFDKSSLPDIRSSIQQHFSDWTYYPTILDLNRLETEGNTGIGDPYDDLCDIITDLSEVLWRMEHNSMDDGCWFFQFIFEAHTREHIIRLLDYLQRKNSQ